jgi:hypothetical protein
MDPFVTQPKGVSHNVTLTILPYDPTIWVFYQKQE